MVELLVDDFFFLLKRKSKIDNLSIWLIYFILLRSGVVMMAERSVEKLSSVVILLLY